MGLREQLREKEQEISKIYEKLSKEIYEDEESSNPSFTHFENQSYISVLAWISEASVSLDNAIDDIPYPH